MAASLRPVKGNSFSTTYTFQWGEGNSLLIIPSTKSVAKASSGPDSTPYLSKGRPPLLSSCWPVSDHIDLLLMTEETRAKGGEWVHLLAGSFQLAETSGSELVDLPWVATLWVKKKYPFLAMLETQSAEDTHFKDGNRKMSVEKSEQSSRSCEWGFSSELWWRQLLKLLKYFGKTIEGKKKPLLVHRTPLSTTICPTLEAIFLHGGGGRGCTCPGEHPEMRMSCVNLDRRWQPWRSPGTRYRPALSSHTAHTWLLK